MNIKVIPEVKDDEDDIENDKKIFTSQGKIEDLIRSGLGRNNMPFHWNTFSFRAFLYDGEPYSVSARSIDVEDKFVKSLFKIVKKDIEEGLNGDDRKKLSEVWEKISDELASFHEEDKMICFYDFDIRKEDWDLIMRYKVVE